VALASRRVGALDVVQRLPSFVGAAVSRVPERWQPQPDPSVGVVALDADGRTVRRLIGAVDGLPFLTGVRESGGALWFGSLQGEHVATLGG
jgi:hypothetical protein